MRKKYTLLRSLFNLHYLNILVSTFNKTQKYRKKFVIPIPVKFIFLSYKAIYNFQCCKPFQYKLTINKFRLSQISSQMHFQTKLKVENK